MYAFHPPSTRFVLLFLVAADLRMGKWTQRSNPVRAATCPSESALPITLRPDFLVDFEGYAGGAEHRPWSEVARKRSLRADILRTS